MTKITPKLLLQWVLQDFWKIALVTVFFAAFSVYYALSIPNKYSTQTKVTSNLSDSKSMGGALGKLGGLASMAGFSLGGGSALSPEVISEILRSNSFLAEYIRYAKLEKEIMAAKEFDASTKTFVYDQTIYDSNTNKWVREFKYPQELEPSDIELVEKFKDLYSVGFARKTKIITVSMTSLSPEFSQRVLVDLVAYFNEYLRKLHKKDYESSIEYLREELKVARYTEVRAALQQILEEQYKKLAVAETRSDYALNTIEHPLLAANKSEPKRAVICVVITGLGGVIGTVFFWSLRIFRRK